jgi:hypothetical protein
MLASMNDDHLARLHMDKVTPRTMVVLSDVDAPSLVDLWLKKHAVHPLFARSLRSNSILQEGVRLCREAGLIDSFEFILTIKGQRFIESLGSDWTTWPVSVPVSYRRVHLKKALYLRKVTRNEIKHGLNQIP